LGEKREQTKHKTWFPLVGTCQKKCRVKCQKHSTFIFSKNIFVKDCSHAYIYMYIYIYTDSGTRRERSENNQNTNMVSISWYLPEKVRMKYQKHNTFKFPIFFFRKLFAYILYMYICIRTVAHGGRKERTNKTQTWFPLVGTCQKKCGMKSQKHNTSKFSKKLFFENCPHAYIYMYTYIYRQWHKEGEKREQTTHKTWFPVVGTCQKKCRMKCQKNHNTF